MRPLFALVFALCAFSLAQASDGAVPQPTTAVGPDDNRIAYMGRVDLSAQGARMAYPGVTIRFVYRGPAPVIKMTADSATCFFNLSCNGWDPVVIHLNKGANEFTLPSGTAPAGGWLVELVRRTESWMGVASFDGLLLPAGCELLPPPPWPDRRLLFLGDSPTCGVFDECYPPENDRSPRTTNAARGYAMLLARWLGAQVHLVSHGGVGITRDWSGKRDGLNAALLLERTLPNSPEKLWDHRRYIPDVVVINFGADFIAGPPDEVEFTNAYAAFVAKVRTDYPQAFLLLCESCFVTDPATEKSPAGRAQLQRTLAAVAARRHQAGDTRIRIAASRYFPGTPADPHLVAFQHEQVALELAGPLREITGW